MYTVYEAIRFSGLVAYRQFAPWKETKDTALPSNWLMTWSLMIRPSLFQFILFKKLESLPSCTSGTICFNASMVPTLPNRATEPSGWWQIHPNPWKNTGGDEWKYIWGQISVRWNLCPNPCFAQVFSTHYLVSLVTLVGFLPSPHLDKNLNFPHPVQNRFNNIQEAFSVVTLGHKLGIEVPSSVLHQQKHAAYQVITPFEHAVGILWLKCLFQSSAKHSLQTFAIILRVDSSICDIFSGSPELMVTYHLTCPWFQLHQRSEPTVSVASFKAIHASAMLAPLTLTWCEQLKDCKRFVISAEWFVHELLESEATAIAVYNCNGSFRDMASKKHKWNKKQVFLAYALGLWLVIRLTMEMDNLLDWTGLCTLAIKWKLESKDKPLAWRHAACICML